MGRKAWFSIALAIVFPESFTSGLLEGLAYLSEDGGSSHVSGVTGKWIGRGSETVKTHQRSRNLEISIDVQH